MKVKVKNQLLEDFVGHLYNSIVDLKTEINEKTMAITALEAVDDSSIVSDSLKSLSVHALTLHNLSLLLYQIKEQLNDLGKENNGEEIEIDIGNNVGYLVDYLNDSLSSLITELNDSMYKLQTHITIEGSNKTKNLSIANISGKLKDISNEINYRTGILESLYRDN
jgi:hypothetical protein